MQWITCPGCHRHIHDHASACPFCATKVVPVLAPLPSALACAVLGLVLGGCVDRKSNDDSGSTTMDESSAGESTSGDDDSSLSSTTANPTSAAAVTYAAPSPDPDELAAQQGTASDTEDDATSDAQ